MKNLLLLLLCCSFFLTTFSQRVITGTITDERTGEGLLGVNVKLKNASSGTVTDISGFFSLEIPNENEILEITFVGYEKKEILVSSLISPVNIQLKESTIGLDQVVITGSRRKEKLLDSPAPISVVTAAQIRNNIPLNLFKNIEQTPGVDIIPVGIVGGNVVTRGFNNIFSGSLFTAVDNRIGSVPSLRVNAFQLIPTSTDDIERIEIVKGPASALYGPNAASGVVHIITKSPLDMKEKFKTRASLTGGLERKVLKGDVWHAGKMHKKVGYKISANYFQGDDWTYDDPAEPDSIFIMLPTSEGSDTIRGPIFNQRDNQIRSYSVDSRFDFRINKDLEIILSSGFRNGSNVEMTGLGASQVINWKYYYAQARLIWKELFAQVYTNFSESGDTYLLRSGNRVVDNSKFIVTQLQHSYKPVAQLRFAYGIDAFLTRPDTKNTLNGRYENDDNINELGIYLQGDYDVSKKISLVGAVRADYHNFVDNIFFSPRAAFVYKPAERHTLRATYNRAFDSPGSTNLSLDVLQGHIPVSHIPIKAAGNRNGFNYNYANNPFMDGSPLMTQYLSTFAGSASLDPDIYSPQNYIHLNDPNLNNVVWDKIKDLVADEFNQALVDAGSPLAGLASLLINYVVPQSIDSVDNVVKSLNLTSFSFEETVDPAALQRIAPLRNAITQTYEIGYKGMLFNRLMLTVDLYRMDKKRFISPITLVSPNVFLNPATLEQQIAAHITQRIYGADPNDPSDNINLFGITPERLVELLDQHPELGNNDGRADDEFIRIFTGAGEQLPFGSITPVENQDGEMILTYSNIGDVTVYGMDIGATFFITEDIKVGGAYSWMNKDTIRVEGAQFGYISLNAPRHKLALNASYYHEKIGLEAGLRWRWQQGFQANSGVYVGRVDAYSVMDLNITYNLHFSKNTEVSLSIQNLIGNKFQPFPGAPAIGRLTMLRVLHEF